MSRKMRDRSLQDRVQAKVNRLVQALYKIQRPGGAPNTPVTADQVGIWIGRRRNEIERFTKQTIEKSFPIESLVTAARAARLELTEALTSQYPSNWRAWPDFLLTVSGGGSSVVDFAALAGLLHAFTTFHKGLDFAVSLEKWLDIESSEDLVQHCKINGLADEKSFFEELLNGLAAFQNEASPRRFGPVSALFEQYSANEATIHFEKQKLKRLLYELDTAGVQITEAAFGVLALANDTCERLIEKSPDRHVLTMLNQHGLLSRLCLYRHAAQLGCNEVHIQNRLAAEGKRLADREGRTSTPRAWSEFLLRSQAHFVTTFCASGVRHVYCTVALLSKVHHVQTQVKIKTRHPGVDASPPAKSKAEAHLAVAQSSKLDVAHWSKLVDPSAEPVLGCTTATHAAKRKTDSWEPLQSSIVLGGPFLGDFPLREWMHGHGFMDALRRGLASADATTLARTAIYALFTPWSSCWHATGNAWFENAPTQGRLVRLVSEVIREFAASPPCPPAFCELRRRLSSLTEQT